MLFKNLKIGKIVMVLIKGKIADFEKDKEGYWVKVDVGSAFDLTVRPSNLSLIHTNNRDGGAHVKKTKQSKKKCNK